MHGATQTALRWGIRQRRFLLRLENVFSLRSYHLREFLIAALLRLEFCSTPATAGRHASDPPLAGLKEVQGGRTSVRWLLRVGLLIRRACPFQGEG